MNRAVANAAMSSGAANTPIEALRKDTGERHFVIKSITAATTEMKPEIMRPRPKWAFASYHTKSLLRVVRGLSPEAVDCVPRDFAKGQRDCENNEEEGATKYRNEPFFENAHLVNALPLPVILLDRLDAYLLFLQTLDRIDYRTRPGDSSRVRYPILEGAAPDRKRILLSLGPAHGVDYKDDLLVLYEVDDMGPSFRHLVDHLDRDPSCFSQVRYKNASAGPFRKIVSFTRNHILKQIDIITVVLSKRP